MGDLKLARSMVHSLSAHELATLVLRSMDDVKHVTAADVLALHANALHGNAKKKPRLPAPESPTTATSTTLSGGGGAATTASCTTTIMAPGASGIHCLSPELLGKIFALIGSRDLVITVPLVCRRWMHVCQELVVAEFATGDWAHARVRDNVLESMLSRLRGVRALDLSGYR